MEMKSAIQHRHDKSIDGRNPRTSLAVEDTQRAEERALPAEMQKRKNTGIGGSVYYLKRDSPSVFQTPSRAVIEKTRCLRIPRDDGSS